MANKTVLDYLRKHHKRYRIEDLKKKILSAGYSQKEIEEALVALRLKSVKPTMPVKPVAKPIAKPVKSVVKPIRPAKPAMPLVEPARLFKQPIKKVEPVKLVGPVVKPAAKPITSIAPSGYSKWLKIAGIAGILVIVFLVLASIFETFFAKGVAFRHVSIIFSLLISIFLILFFYGFVVLGKKYGKKLIAVISWIFIIFIVLFIVLEILLLIFQEAIMNFLFGSLNISSAELFGIEALISTPPSIAVSLIIAFILIGLVVIILNILFGVGLVKLREVKFSKIAGILHIIGACSLIIGIGFLVLLIAFVFEIILLFRESKQV